MELLVAAGIVCVHVDFFVLEHDAFRRVFVENYAQGDQLFFLAREESMFLHFVPSWPFLRFILHGVIQEVEALERDFNVLRPGPVTLLNVLVEELECHLIRGFGFDVEDEHAREHLVQNDAYCPDVNLVAVTCALVTPICAKLLSRHHQR